MKKTLILLCILFLFTGFAFGQITFGGTAGVEYTLTDTEGLEGVNLLGFPAQVFGLYRFPQTIPVEGFGEATIDAGLSSGFINNIFGYGDYSLSVVPILGMGRLSVEPIYIDIAAGIYFPMVEGENDISYGGYSEVGYAHPINEQLTLTAGGRFTWIGSSANKLNIIGAALGASYQL